MSTYDEWVKAEQVREAAWMKGLERDVNPFLADDARLARMHGYRPAMAINLRPPREEDKPLGYLLAMGRAFRRIRREWWTRREQGGLMTLGRPAVGGERWEGIG